jgi:glycosyltransferase involved in cell wall biosynthesis
MTTSLVLPCYNPAPQWERNVSESYTNLCAKISGQVEMIIVIDGNGEVTNESLAYLNLTIPKLTVVKYEKNRGKGFALREGIKIAKGDLIIYTDIDFPYTIESICNIHKGLADNQYDVGIGVKNDAYYAKVPAIRRFISSFLRALIRIFLSMPITDTQCGLKGFKKEIAPIFLQTTIDRYLFDLEFVRMCFKSKTCRVKAIPVQLNENVSFRKMNYRILFPEMVNFIKLLFR